MTLERLEQLRKLARQSLNDDWASSVATDTVDAVVAGFVSAYIQGHAEAWREMGRRYANLLRLATPGDHIENDFKRQRELAIYRSESQFCYAKSREVEKLA